MAEEKTRQALPIEEINQLTKTLVDTMADGTPKGIRNEIAHSALFQHIAIVRYTEHLYDYLATYISEIVRFACKKDITSFGTLSAAINDNYQEFEIVTNDKKVKDKKSLLGNLWTSGIMNFI